LKYLLDTDWIIDHLNGVEAVTKKLEEFAPFGLCTSVISVAELYDGSGSDRGKFLKSRTKWQVNGLIFVLEAHF